jgi:predicted aspartyl protease
MRQTCIDARGLERFARLQRLPARAWTIATLLALLVPVSSEASTRIDPDSLISLREKTLPSGSAARPTEGGTDSIPLLAGVDASATRGATSSVSAAYSDTYWTAVSELDFSASRNVARSDEESSLAEAMSMLAAGDLQQAENAFARLSRTAKDVNVAVAARILLARTLMYQHKWATLRDLVSSPSLVGSDRVATTSLEQWGRAFANIEPEVTTFPAAPVTLPLRMTKAGTPAIRVTVNGKEYEFWLDTGSSMTVVSSDVAAAARIPIIAAETLQVRTFAGLARVRPALVRTIEVGAIRLLNTPAIIIDESMMRVKTSRDGGPIKAYRVDGILGWDFIRQFDVVLDFQKGVVTLTKPEWLGTAGTGAQNLIWMGEPMVEVRSKQGTSLHFSLDTGAQSTFLNATVLDKLGAATMVATARVFGIASTGTSTNRKIPSLSLSIGGRSIALEDVIVYGPRYSSLIGCDGVLGSDVAAGGVIEIDATNGVFSVG